MIEPPRKHGPFDLRYPAASKSPIPPREHGAGTDAGLDWAAFVGRFFPHSRRHSLEAVNAYAAYRKAPEWGAMDHASSGRPTTEKVALHSVGVAS